MNFKLENILYQPKEKLSIDHDDHHDIRREERRRREIKQNIAPTIKQQVPKAIIDLKQLTIASKSLSLTVPDQPIPNSSRTAIQETIVCVILMTLLFK